MTLTHFKNKNKTIEMVDISKKKKTTRLAVAESLIKIDQSLYQVLLNDQNLFNQEIPKDYFRIENVKKRWRKVLSKSQIIMIENILSYCFDKFGYKKLFSNNIFNKFYWLIRSEFSYRYLIFSIIISFTR